MELLQKACARNSAVELNFEPADGPSVHCRARLLHFDSANERLLIEKPTYNSESDRIPALRPLTGYLQLGSRYEFQTEITEVGFVVKLNDNLRVRAMALALPDKVVESQRRRYYRLGIAGDPISTQLAAEHPDHADACPIDGPVTSARIVSLSAGGLGVLVRERDAELLDTMNTCFCVFSLPGNSVRFDVRLQWRHQRTISPNGNVRVGYSFEIGCGREELLELRQSIAHWIAAYERARLRRRRRA